MRLWIDDPAPLAGLRPGVDPRLACQKVDGVEIRHWPPCFPDVEAADVVIEAFACELPSSFVVAMAARAKPPVWLNLEYLSAEDWVVGCHGLPSPHPTLALTKYFFFPGFVFGTGGLIRETALPMPLPRETWHGLVTSLFCYDNPALPGLLDTWAAGDEPVRCRVADGLPRRQVEHWLGEAFASNATVRRGKLFLQAMPFLAQTDYDRLLGTCDLNFVRGEDSFVRAQWAEQAFVWQPYPQAEEAHQAKLAAFLDRYVRDLPVSARQALTGFWRAWNGDGDIRLAWPDFRAALPQLKAHANPWATEIARPGNLAENLVCFCRARL